MSGDWFDRIGSSPFLLPPTLRKSNGSAAVMAQLRECRASERLPPADLSRRQRARLLALAQHAAAHSPHFATRLQGAGLTPAALAEDGGLAKLPPLTRRELVSAGDALFCQVCPPGHGRLATTTTSGSTGEPVKVRRTEFCQLHWLAYTLREHLWHDRDFAGRLAVLRANIAEPVSTPDWGPPCNLLFRTGPGSAMPPSRTVQELCKWLRDREVLCLQNTIAIHTRSRHNILQLPSGSPPSGKQRGLGLGLGLAADATRRTTLATTAQEAQTDGLACSRSMPRPVLHASVR